MAKGDDALARKRNKVRRKRLRSGENAVSERVAAIIASKRRRKSGKRRACEGMCFSLQYGADECPVKDQETMAIADVEEFATVLVVDFPPSVDEYVEILTGAAHHIVGGEVHSIISNVDAPVAKPLAELLANCGQEVPEFLKKLEAS